MTKEKKYYIPDMESGETYEVTKEQHENYLALWDSVMPKYDPENNVGKVIVFGTSGDMDSKEFNNFEKMWKDL